MKQLSNKLWINENTVISCVKIKTGDSYKFLLVTQTGQIETTEEIYEELKDYEGGGGGSGGNSTIQFKNIEVSETSWIESTEYEGYNYKAIAASNEKIKEAKDGFVVFEDETADDSNFAMDVKIDTTEGKIYIFAIEPKVAKINRVIVLLTKPVDPDQGGANLNIVYSKSKPKDTDKIWIQSNKPENIKIVKNADWTIKEDQSLMKKEVYDLTNNFNSTRYVQTVCYILDNNFYVSSSSNGQYDGGTFDNSSYGRMGLFVKYNLLTKESVQITAPQQLCGYIYKHNDKYYMICGQSQVTYIYEFEDDNFEVSKSKNVGYVSGVSPGPICEVGDYIYMFRNTSSSYSPGSSVVCAKIDKNNFTYSNVSFTWISEESENYYAGNNIFYAYNGKIYSMTGGSISNCGLYEFDLEKNEIHKIVNNFVDSKNTPYKCEQPCIKGYGNQIFIFPGTYNSSSAYSDIIIYDINTKEIKHIPLDTAIKQCFVAIDNKDGTIYLFENSLYKKALKLNDLYNLNENNLMMYYDSSSNVSLPLIKTDGIDMIAPINHAWLGDENNSAQPVNMYIYDEETSTWKGINCPDYEG